jgi:hypothetical protein
LRFSVERLVETGCCRSRSGGERRRPPEADLHPCISWLAPSPRKPPFTLRMKDESICASTAARYDCSLCRRPPALDPNLPAGLLQSSRTASHRFSCFATANLPFVTSQTRPDPDGREWPVQGIGVNRSRGRLDSKGHATLDRLGSYGAKRVTVTTSGVTTTSGLRTYP